MKSISLRIPDNLASQLTAAAGKKRALSSIVRQALEQHFLEPKNIKKLSFYALGHDLCGSLQGHADLSTNPKYLDGFGR